MLNNISSEGFLSTIITQITSNEVGWRIDSAYIALIIIGIALVLYVKEFIPIATTSLLACLALVATGVLDFGQAFGGFANDMVFLIVGMVVVGNALFETGAAQTAGRGVLKLVGGNEKFAVIILILIAIIPAAFLSNTAAAAMMLPVAVTAIHASGGKFRKKRMYMVIGIAAVTSGGLTMVGSTPQLIAQSRLTEAGFERFGFFDIILLGAPIIILLLLFYLTIGHKILDKMGEDPKEEHKRVVNPQALSTPSLIKMWIVLAVLIFCIVGFITELWTLGTVAMTGAVICIITGCISQRRVFETMDWNTVVIIGGSLGLSAGLAYSGAGQMIAEGAVGLLGENASPWFVASLLALVVIILGNFMSATATAALFIPITISIAIQMNIDVHALVMAVIVACNITYATPVSTPPLTMTLSAGYKFTDYLKFGGLFNLLAYLLVIALFPLVLNL